MTENTLGPYRSGWCPKCHEKGYARPLKTEYEDYEMPNGYYHCEVTRVTYVVCTNCSYRKIIDKRVFNRELDFEEIPAGHRPSLGWVLETAFVIGLIIFFLKECNAF